MRSLRSEWSRSGRNLSAMEKALHVPQYEMRSHCQCGPWSNGLTSVVPESLGLLTRSREPREGAVVFITMREHGGLDCEWQPGL